MFWTTKKLGEICEIIAGQAPPSDFYNKEGKGIPFLRVNSFGEIYPKVDSWTTKPLKLSRSSDVLLSVAGSVGFVNLGINACITRSIFALRPNKEILQKLLFYILKSKSKMLSEIGQGSAQRIITRKQIESFKIPLPPLPEQRKIVYVLDSIQDAIRAQEKIIEKTKELKKSLLNEIFNSKIKNQKWTKLENTNYFEIKLGGTPKTNVAEYWNGKIYWITPNDLNKLHSQYISNTERKITQKGLNAGSTLLPAGSIILSTRAPIGYLAILNEDMAFNQGCKGIVVKKPNEVSNLYLFYYLSTQISKLRELGSGSTFRELSTSDLEQLSIPLVNIIQQREIAEILQTIDQKIEIEQKKKALYEELFKTMLNKLMTREIKVDNLKI
ncbi:MAG: restriction endonuclease subunit S [Candidatus Paceibacterota bacterium]